MGLSENAGMTGEDRKQDEDDSAEGMYVESKTLSVVVERKRAGVLAEDGPGRPEGTRAVDSVLGSVWTTLPDMDGDLFRSSFLSFSPSKEGDSAEFTACDVSRCSYVPGDIAPTLRGSRLEPEQTALLRVALR